ncbi:hypothetical protein [Blastopirellula marina]|uniref:Uncharacterized protein n=1 Tax=Blastopirellula marina DSM 3645 TaxID=314230 RepID=A4A1D6_9BACT|nr:hypothetical protein [Blastopirellula marina]EAQ77385.1 hypothetical protein DSM3645_04450 [Blastopirellula marina DSM 3645]
MNTTESPDIAEIEKIVQRVVERQQADSSAKERNLRRQRKANQRRKQRRKMGRSVEVVKWCMIFSVFLALISMIGVVWTAYQVDRTVNMVEREIAQFHKTIYNPVENAAAALGRQVDERIEDYFQAKPETKVENKTDDGELKTAEEDRVIEDAE